MSEKLRMLFVEDDALISSGLNYTFESEGFEVIHRATLREALYAVAAERFDVAVLDLSLPDGTGFEICKAIKERHGTPVLFLTAADDEANTVKGLELGADDYIAKPFRLRELMARICAALRRSGERDGKAETDVITLGDVTLDASSARVTRAGAEVVLSASEYRLLLALARNKGQILSRSQLLETLWDSGGEFVNDNTLTVCMKRLREKLYDDPRGQGIIETVRGLGYRAGG